MESNINKRLKKLDLNSIKQQENSIKDDKITTNVNYCQIKNITENILTKDYEKFMDLLSYEDNLSDKMVDLQNPYFYIHIKDKYKTNKFDSHKYLRSKEEFLNNLNARFAEFSRNSSSKASIVNNYRFDKLKLKK